MLFSPIHSPGKLIQRISFQTVYFIWVSFVFFNLSWKSQLWNSIYMYSSWALPYCTAVYSYRRAWFTTRIFIEWKSIFFPFVSHTIPIYYSVQRNPWNLHTLSFKLKVLNNNSTSNWYIGMDTVQCSSICVFVESYTNSNISILSYNALGGGRRH